MIQALENEQECLMQQFQIRKKKNPRYSIRAYARDLGVSPAMVSQLFQGKALLSVASAEKIGTRLGLPPALQSYFVACVAERRAKTKPERLAAQERKLEFLTQIQPLTWAEFARISDWHSIAILELSQIKSIPLTAAHVSKHLGIPKKKAEESIQTLIELQLLIPSSPISKGRYHTRPYRVTASDQVDPLGKKLQLQVLKKAEQALQTQPVAQREFSSTFFRVRKSDLPRAKNLIRDFRRQLMLLCEQGEGQDSVYCLQMGLFDLAKTTEPTYSEPTEKR